MPLRADDASKTNYIVIDVLRSIISVPLAICDLSGRNPNVMYELGVRQAFNKPVVLLKDSRTEKIFDIQGLRYAEYDESLRVDTVQRDTERLAGFLRNTEAAQDINSVVQLLGVKPAEAAQDVKLSEESSVLLSAIEGLGDRIRVIERAIMPARRRSPGVTLPDGSTATIGETIYDGTMEEFGVLLDIEQDGVRIRTTDGKILRMRNDSPLYKSLTTIPF